ncbi:hypothetical protein BDC45DRAFT_479065 [Circinella umbellata]|nr:hypothetical protein BDC45DRAFT_479065 [Circinella umbellata]
MFWDTSLDHMARNFWYRSIHGNLPTSIRLSQAHVSYVSSEQCRLCHQATDTIPHFLIFCPLKTHVWSIIWGSIFFTNPHLEHLLTFIQELSLSSHTPILAPRFTSYHLVVGCTLHTIWAAYWRSVIHGQTFVPHIVARQALATIAKIQASAILD